MPIPLIDIEIPALRNQRPALRLVNPLAPVNSRARSHPLWYPRFLAHVIDMTIAAGFTIYLTKLLAVLLLSLHMGQIKATGKTAGGLFLESFAYGQFLLAGVVFAAVAMALFIAVPARFGITPGLGAFGLKLEGQDGETPDLMALSLRTVACAFGYLSFGFLTLSTLRGLEGSFLQDRFSKTRVVEQFTPESLR
ncbi:MAG: hypothetical protein EOP11_13350 [Proteobacteria bacterium]|nr:MAG: hypothetical protein EOP11_13350 [Pseudomonadota bacterium]